MLNFLVLLVARGPKFIHVDHFFPRPVKSPRSQ